MNHTLHFDKNENLFLGDIMDNNGFCIRDLAHHFAELVSNGHGDVLVYVTVKDSVGQDDVVIPPHSRLAIFKLRASNSDDVNHGDCHSGEKIFVFSES